MSTLTVEALENIAKLACQRIDAGLRHHGEQWRLGGRTGINFMMAKLRRLAMPQPPKDDGEVLVPELIDQLQDACVTSDGTPLTDNAEPWGCDVGLLRKAIAALSALPQHPPAERAARSQAPDLDSVMRARGSVVEREHERVMGLRKLEHEALANAEAAAKVCDDGEREYQASLAIAARNLYAHPSPTHAGSGDSEALKLASKIGVFYHNGKVNLGAPLYAFTPTEIIEFARRLAGADHA